MGRALRADYIYTGKDTVIPNGVVEFSADGTIEHIGPLPSGRIAKLEKVEGSILPALINCHCHLELSHLKDQLQQKTGLTGFIKNLQKHRQADEVEIAEAMNAADAEMRKNGIVAVGDISNSTQSFEIKQQSSLYYHTFVELFAFDKSKAEKVFNDGKFLQKQLQNKSLIGSISPHSPYSVSFELMKMITEDQTQLPLSIHNQETEEENLMYREKKGKMLEMLHEFKLDTSDWNASKSSSLQGYLKRLPSNRNLLLVHNTYTSLEDVLWAEEQHPQLYWCFCPKANLFIEGNLPALAMFDEQAVKCTLGTDSLASNDSLSILEEMKCIQQHFPSISLKSLIKWATYNGAEFLGIQDQFGSLEVGKSPGILLLKGLQNERLSQQSSLHRLI